MGRMEKRKLAQAGHVAMEKLDLPGEVALGVPRVELVGNREFYMDRHKGVVSYSTELVEISGGSMEVRLIGHGLQLIAMTDDELRITGHIEKVELVG